MFGKVSIISKMCVLLLFAAAVTGSCQNMPGPPPDSSRMEADFKTALDKLVATKVITSTQETAIIQRLQDNAKNGMPPQGDPSQSGFDPLSSLVKDGTITQEQADAVQKALPKPPGMGDGNEAPPPPPGQMSDGIGTPPPPPGSNSRTTVKTSGVYTQSSGTASKSNQAIDAKKKDESAVKVCGGATLNMSDSKLAKSGDTSATESSDFYGLNAAVLAESAGKVELSDCQITTNAEGGNAVFATGHGSSITLTNVTISTTGRGSSRGLDGTFGASITARNVNITTVGAHCAAIATDRGGANVNVTGGVMSTSGEGSPSIYSTGNISVTGAKMIARGSEAAVIEGKNSILLTDSILVAHKKCGAMLYQSFSGDAELGTSVFTMNGGSMTAEVGPVFYSTNTQVKINLNAASLSAKSGVFLNAAAGRWGRSGANGADVTLTAENQNLVGDITCDKISTINASLKDRSILKGAVNTEKTAKSIVLALDKTSKWIVTGTSYITSLSDDDSSLSNIVSDGFTVYYDPSYSATIWLGGKTYPLSSGGKLAPMD